MRESQCVGAGFGARRCGLGGLQYEEVGLCDRCSVWRFVCYGVWRLLSIGIVDCGSCGVGELWCVGVALWWSQCVWGS